MRQSGILSGLAMAVVLAAAGGCERGDSADEPKVYDPAVDAPPSRIVVDPDPQLLADQTEIAKRAAALPTVRLPVRGPEAGGTPAEAVRLTLLAMHDAVDANQMPALAEFLVPPDAEAVKTVLDALPALEEKMATVRQLVKEKLGAELPKDEDDVRAQLAMVLLPPWLSRAALAAQPSALQFAPSSKGVVVSDGQESMTFVSIGGAWKAELAPPQRQTISFMSEIMQALDTMVDAITAGVNDGTITAENLEAKMQEQGEKVLGPVMAKFAAAAAAQMTPAGGTGALTAEGGTAAPPAEALAPPPGERPDPGHLESVARLWGTENKDQAVKEFLWIDWDKPAMVGAESSFALTDAQLIAMPAADRQVVTQQTDFYAKAIKELATHMVGMAQQGAAPADPARVQPIVESLISCAKYLRQPKRLAALRQTGEDIAKALAPLSPDAEIATAPVPAVARPGEGPVDPGYLEEVGAIWLGGDKERGLKEFLRIDWRKPAILAPDSIFLYTDEAVLGLAPDERKPIVAEMAAVDRALLRINNYVRDRARDAQKANDTAKAKQYVEALANLGSYLQRPSHLKAIQLRGQSITDSESPVTGKPIGAGLAPAPAVLAPAAPATMPAVPPATPPASAEENINQGRGPEAAEALRNRLLAPARRGTGGGN